MNTGIGAEVFFFVFFVSCFLPAQAVLFLCATSNLNLLCKDGYIFLALFVRPKYRMLVYWLYKLNREFQLRVLYKLISSYNDVLYNAFKVIALFKRKIKKKK